MMDKVIPSEVAIYNEVLVFLLDCITISSIMKEVIPNEVAVLFWVEIH